MCWGTEREQQLNTSAQNMDILIWIVVIIVILLAKQFLSKQDTLGGKVIPSPRGKPIIGHLLLMKTDPHRNMLALSREYGPVFRLQLGEATAVVVNVRIVGVNIDFDLCKQIFQRHWRIFNNRPKTPMRQHYSNFKGILHGRGNEWKKSKEFTHSLLFQKSILQSDMMKGIMTENFTALIQKWKEMCTDHASGVEINVTNDIMGCFLNVIGQLAFSHKFCDLYGNEMSEKSKVLLKAVNDLFESLGTPVLSSYFSWLWFLKNPKEQDMIRGRRILGNFQNEILEEHRRTYDPTKNRDLIDSYLSQPEGKISEEDFNQIMIDLMAAGADTTATTSQWMLYLLATHQEVQKQLRTELLSVLSTDNSTEIQFHHLPQMPHMLNVQRETMRLYPVIPLISHECEEAAVVGGYYIPQNAWVFPNFFAMSRDPAVWGKDAEEFNPDRYNDENMSAALQKITDEQIQFGIGPRKCVGKDLAVLELRMFVANILLNFEITVAEGYVPKEQLDIALRPSNNLKLILKSIPQNKKDN